MNLDELIGAETHGENQYDYIVLGDGGRIVSTMNVPPLAMTALIDIGANIVMAKGDPSTQWFNGLDVVARPPNPARVEGLSIVDVPIPSFIWFGGDRHPVVDGIVDLSGSDPGQYRIRIDSFPELDKVLEIEITS